VALLIWELTAFSWQGCFLKTDSACSGGITSGFMNNAMS
jgi:hypothetical protein